MCFCHLWDAFQNLTYFLAFKQFSVFIWREHNSNLERIYIDSYVLFSVTNPWHSTSEIKVFFARNNIKNHRVSLFIEFHSSERQMWIQGSTVFFAAEFNIKFRLKIHWIVLFYCISIPNEQWDCQKSTQNDLKCEFFSSAQSVKYELKAICSKSAKPLNKNPRRTLWILFIHCQFIWPVILKNKKRIVICAIEPSRLELNLSLYMIIIKH